MDADQSIRKNANLRELHDIDLKKKPYGFVSHCKILETYFLSDFWRDILKSRGLEYYFGGIFVADIDKFRHYAFGSYLR